MQSLDTISVPQDGGGGVSLIKVGKDVRQVQNLGQTKFLKENLFPDTVFMNFTLQKSQTFGTNQDREVYVNHPLYDSSHGNVHVPFKSLYTYSKMVSFSVNG